MMGDHHFYEFVCNIRELYSAATKSFIHVTVYYQPSRHCTTSEASFWMRFERLIKKLNEQKTIFFFNFQHRVDPRLCFTAAEFFD